MSVELAIVVAHRNRSNQFPLLGPRIRWSTKIQALVYSTLRSPHTQKSIFDVTQYIDVTLDRAVKAIPCADRYRFCNLTARKPAQLKTSACEIHQLELHTAVAEIPTTRNQLLSQPVTPSLLGTTLMQVTADDP